MYYLALNPEGASIINTLLNVLDPEKYNSENIKLFTHNTDLTQILRNDILMLIDNDELPPHQKILQQIRKSINHYYILKLYSDEKLDKLHFVIWKYRICLTKYDKYLSKQLTEHHILHDYIFDFNKIKHIFYSPTTHIPGGNDFYAQHRLQ